MTESKCSATVRMVAIVEIDVGVWDGANSFDSLNEQVRREARATLARLLGSNGRVVDLQNMRVTLEEKR